MGARTGHRRHRIVVPPESQSDSDVRIGAGQSTRRYGFETSYLYWRRRQSGLFVVAAVSRVVEPTFRDLASCRLVLVLDVRLELGGLDTPDPPTADLDGGNLAGRDEGSRLPFGHGEGLRNLLEVDEAWCGSVVGHAYVVAAMRFRSGCAPKPAVLACLFDVTAVCRASSGPGCRPAWRVGRVRVFRRALVPVSRAASDLGVSRLGCGARQSAVAGAKHRAGNGKRPL